MWIYDISCIKTIRTNDICQWGWIIIYHKWISKPIFKGFNEHVDCVSKLLLNQEPNIRVISISQVAYKYYTILSYRKQDFVLINLMKIKSEIEKDLRRFSTYFKIISNSNNSQFFLINLHLQGKCQEEHKLTRW